MITVNTGKCKLSFYKVNKHFDKFKISGFGYLNWMYDFTTRVKWHTAEDAKLPQGKWQIIGFTDELTEGDCKELVKSSYLYNHEKYICYRDYNWVTFELLEVYDTATESFESLLESSDIIGRHIVLRKIEHE